jgi:phage/plasmid-associated DNA primase
LVQHIWNTDIENAPKEKKRHIKAIITGDKVQSEGKV